MGINRKVLEKVLKESDTFAIKVIDRQVLKRSVLATIEFEDQAGVKTLTDVEFHVWQGWTYKSASSFVYLKAFCEYVYETYKSERKTYDAKIKVLTKKMEEILIDSWFNFSDYADRKGVTVPANKKDFSKFVQDNQDLCKGFLNLIESFEEKKTA